MSRGFPWGELGLARGSDAGAIRRAYATRLKAMDVDADPEAYARLRDARDTALRLAKQAAPLPPDPSPPAAMIADDPGDAEGAQTLAPWPLAGSNRVCPNQGDVIARASVVATFPAAAALSAPFITLANSFVRSAHPAEGYALHWPFAPATLATPDGAIRPVQRPEARLRHLLLDVDPELGAMSDADEGEARGCLNAMLNEAACGTLARHEAIERMLAHMLAHGWPRSAPLLEQAAQALGWTAQAGRLGESAEVAFLTTRLAGLVFERAVQEPSHPHHAAWAELTCPGTAGFLRRMTFRPARVNALLSHIRQHFPELEDHLDASRVASWSNAHNDRVTLKWIGVALLVVLRLATVFANPHDGGQQPRPISPPPVVDQRIAPELAKAVTATFGEGHTPAWLEQHQPELAKTMAVRVSMALQTDAQIPTFGGRSIEQQSIDWVRTRSYFAARKAGGAELDQAMRLRLAVLDGVGNSAEACMRFVTTGETGAGFIQRPSDRLAAQKLFAAQAEAGELLQPNASGKNTATVPGLLMQRVIAETRLPRDRVVAAMQNKGTDADRCAVTRALLRATLAWKGKEHRAILMTL